MPKLAIELVPQPCWYHNLRAVISRSQWDHLRRETYAQYGYHCGICGTEGRLECHELWHYDDEQYIQRLDGFIALCSWCHHIKHIGHAGILAASGKLDYEQLVAHFQHVNRCDREAFEQHLHSAWAQWRTRNQHAWTTSLGPYARLVLAGHEPTIPSRRAATSLSVTDVAPDGVSEAELPGQACRPGHSRVTATESNIGGCGDSSPQPSTYTKDFWLYAERTGGEYPEHTERGGKWMIFVPVTQVDDVWEAIKRALEAGELGRLAKVATARSNPHARDPQERVICVYTYDVEDRQDVFHIRRSLRRLGFTANLPYKTDVATRCGSYRTPGGKRVSVYYE